MMAAAGLVFPAIELSQLLKSADYTQSRGWQRDFGRITGNPEVIRLAGKRAFRRSATRRASNLFDEPTSARSIRSRI